MKIDVLTLFPEMIAGVMGSSMMKKAQEQKAIEYQAIDFRAYANNKHQQVDDYPNGGVAGMVLVHQSVVSAVDAIKKKINQSPRVILICPQGERFDQEKAEDLTQELHLVFICGHYEGYDERN